MRGILDRAVLLAALVLLALLGARRFARPAPGPADTPRGEFSAERALQLVERLAVRPRPVGSPGHAWARAAIVGELTALGFDVSERPAVGLRVLGERLLAARTVQIVARLPGTDAQAAPVWFAAHYDSVPNGPGAADDASGVAVLLEAGRAMASSPPARPVGLLFTDAEEAGLLGAHAWLQDPPPDWPGAGVLNLDARGARGPAIVFRSGPRSGAFERLVERADPPVGFDSAAAAVARLLPNDTDFGAFSRRGVAGLDCAFFRDVQAYHTALDRTDRLDLSALQAAGSLVLAAARSSDRFDPASARLSFDVAGLVRLGLPLGAARIAGIALGGVVLVFLWRLRRRAPQDRRFRWASLVPFAWLLLAVPAAWGAVRLVHHVLGLDRGPFGVGGRAFWLEDAHVAAQILVALSFVAAAAGAIGRPSLLRALAGSFALGAVALSAFEPAASHHLALPALALAAAVAFEERARGAVRRIGGSLLAALPTLLVTAPVVGLAGYGLTARMGALHAAAAAALLLPLAPSIAALGPRRTGASAALGAAFLYGAVALAPATPERPRWESVVDWVDAEEGEAWRLSLDATLEEYAAAALGPRVERRALEMPILGRRLEVFAAPLGGIEDAPPVVLEKLRVEEDRRTVTLGVPDDALAVELRLPRRSRASFAGALGKAAPDGGRVRVLDVFGPGGRIEFEIAEVRDRRLELECLVVRAGLAAAAPERPPESIPPPRIPETTVVRSVVRILQ